MDLRLALLLWNLGAGAWPPPAGPFKISDVRPTLGKRTFNSSLVNFLIKELNTSLPQPLATLFGNCLPNTLDTTVLAAVAAPSDTGEIHDTFVITGDIPAMWLRDSMNQVYPYVRVLSALRISGKSDATLENFLFGVVHRQAASILIDHYANSFAWWGPKGVTGEHKTDQTYSEFEYGGGQVNAMQNLRLFERKFEIDSLASLLKLATGLDEAVAPGTAPRLFLRDQSFIPAVVKVLDTFKEMQSCSSNIYTFQRQTSEPTDTLSHGVGSPCLDTGMVRTHFRPSDDAVVYAFNIPGNAMVAVEVGRIVPLLRKMIALYNAAPSSYPWASKLTALLGQAVDLERDVRNGIASHGTMEFHGQKVYAYEVDGFGNAIFMDDANVPSLLSLPFLGFVSASDPLYRATRSLVLSKYNPWYFKGTLGIAGVGGPHVGIGHIWPMSLMIQAWTSDDVAEVSTILKQLMHTSFPNSLMHESFNQDSGSASTYPSTKNEPKDYTRPWFAWANTLFGDLVLKIAADPVMYKAVNLTKPLDLPAIVAKWNPSKVESTMTMI